MNQLNHTTILTTLLNHLKTVADSAFVIVGPGEPDPDRGETPAADAVTCFARLDSIRWKPDPRRLTAENHTATFEAVVLLFVTGANEDPIADAAAELQSMVNVIDLACLTTATGTGTLQMDLMVSEVTETHPTPDAQCNRLMAIKIVGEIKTG